MRLTNIRDYVVYLQKSYFDVEINKDLVLFLQSHRKVLSLIND